MIFGIRPEHLELRREGGLQFVVTNVERLGNETIVYGKLGSQLGEFTMKDEGNHITVKVVDRDDIEVGDVVFAAPNPEKVHFFDAETEITLMNRIPTYNSIPVQTAGDKMRLLDTQTALPPVYAAALDGAKEFELTVPPAAIVPGSDFCRRIAKIEEVDDKRLAYLENGDSYLFALVGEDARSGQDYRFGLLYDKLGVIADGKTVLEPLGDSESLTGTFTRTEKKENGERVQHFFYCIGDYAVEAIPEQGYKINSIDGDACYKKTYRYSVPRDRIRLADDSENALSGTVTALIDYGSARFAKVEAAGQTVTINASADVKEGPVRLAFDSADVSVYSTTIDMKIC